MPKISDGVADGSNETLEEWSRQSRLVFTLVILVLISCGHQFLLHNTINSGANGMEQYTAAKEKVINKKLHRGNHSSNARNPFNAVISDAIRCPLLWNRRIILESSPEGQRVSPKLKQWVKTLNSGWSKQHLCRRIVGIQISINMWNKWSYYLSLPRFIASECIMEPNTHTQL